MTNYPAIAGTVLENLRKKQPRVHCLTNGVALNFTANILLAIGGLPSMTDDIREVEAFTSSANALLINLGQLSDIREQAILAAIAAANETHIPWVLDPVFIHRSPLRANFAQQLLKLNPTLVRGNTAEWEALNAPQNAHYVAALSAPIDEITHNTSKIYIHNGHPYMSQVTAMGCAGTALIAACIAAHKNAFEATIAGFLILGVAGELAAQKSNGVGTFAPAFLDTLGMLTPEKLEIFGKATQ